MFIKPSLFWHLKQLPHNCIFQIVHVRKVQISVIGAANEVGENLSILLKTSNKVSRLHIYDDYEKINGMGLELRNIPGGPIVQTFCGDRQLASAIFGSEIITIVTRKPGKHENTPQEMIIENAPTMQKVCKAITHYNPTALLAIATNPLNSLVPFASTLMAMYNSYNPFKIFGIMQIHSLRARAFAAKVLDIDPQLIHVPVVGGYSAETIVPLFSYLQPYYNISADQADMLTRMVRTADREVLFNKQGAESATLAKAWSIYECIDTLVDAVNGQPVVLNAFSTNLLYGTRYLSWPVKIGADGILETLTNFEMNDFEKDLLKTALPVLQDEISKGEAYVDIVKTLGRYQI